MRNIKPEDNNEQGEAVPAITHPKFGVITSGEDVYKHRKHLSQAPPNIKTSAAFMLLRDTNFPVLLAQFVAEVVAEDDNAKATKKLDRIMNFVLIALHSSIQEEARGELSSHYKNN